MKHVDNQEIIRVLKIGLQVEFIKNAEFHSRTICDLNSSVLNIPHSCTLQSDKIIPVELPLNYVTYCTK